MSQRGFGLIVLILAIFLLGIVGLAGYQIGKARSDANVQPTIIPSSTPIPSVTKVTREPLSPEKVVESYYLSYLNCVENHFQSDNNRSPIENCPQKNVNLTQKAIEALEVGIGYDHTLCAQDTPATIMVDAPVINSNSAQVTVHTFYEQSGDHLIPVRLVQNSGGYWQIDEIKCIP
jgi:hypothetical protein